MALYPVFIDLDFNKQQALNLKVHPLSTTARLALSLSAGDAGLAIWDSTLGELFFWTGVGWTRATLKPGLRPTILTDSATIAAVDSSLFDYAYLDALSQDSTISNPIGLPSEGQLLSYRITSSALRNLVWGSAFIGTSMPLPPNTSGAGLDDLFIFLWNSTKAKWCLVDSTFGQMLYLQENSLRYTFSGGAGNAVVSAFHLTSAAVDRTLGNINTAQNIFDPAIDTITLASNTSYMVEGFYKLNTGTINHTTAIGFAGTLTTLGTFEYEAKLWSAAANGITTIQSTIQISGTATRVLNSNSNQAFTNIKLKGILRVNSGGTFIPQVSFSVAPGGPNQLMIGSYLSITPLGLASISQVGNWG